MDNFVHFYIVNSKDFIGKLPAVQTYVRIVVNSMQKIDSAVVRQASSRSAFSSYYYKVNFSFWQPCPYEKHEINCTMT